jgi:formylglycine-generating enzyme required for sulfatase activity
MKTKLGLLLLMLLIAAGCEDSTQSGETAEQTAEQAAEIAKLQEQVQNLLKITAEKSAADKAEIARLREQVEDLQQQATEPTAEQPLPFLRNTPIITNTIGMKLKGIHAGTFMMGSPANEKDRDDEEHQHKVTITKPFFIQTTEVTQGQWKEVMGTEPWKPVFEPLKGERFHQEGPNYPAVDVSWDDAVAYCKKLSEKEGKT